MSVKALKGNIDKGVYVEAAKSGSSVSMWLEDVMPKDFGYEPTIYQGLTYMEKEMLRRKLDLKGEPVPKTAFELALDSFGIKAFGQFTDKVDKFYQTPGASVLFPEYISNRVYFGQLQASLVKDFIAETVIIEGNDFSKVYLQDAEEERQTSRVARGAEAPSKEFRVGKQTVSLEKYMIKLSIDYEAIYNTPLNLYSVSLQRVGAQLGIDETDDLVYVLLNGDGNSNGLEAAQTKTSVATTKIEKLDIITLADSLPLPYRLDKFVGRKTYMLKFWDALSDMQNPAIQWGQTGMALPMGFEWDRSILTADRFVGVDSRLGISYVTNDAVVMTETDRIIDKQQVMAVMSKRGKFSIIDQDAIGCLDIVH